MHWHRRARRSVFSPGSVFWLASFGLVVGTLGSGCGLGTKEGSEGAEAIKKPELLCSRAGADRVESSSFRGDGKNDIFKVFVRSAEAGGVVLSCKELDLNGDGRHDMLVYYDSRGRKLREEFDQDFDGLADMKSFYEGGQLVRQEFDVDFDGKPDLVEYLENGKRVRIEKLQAVPPAAGSPGKVEAAGPAPGVTSGAPGGAPGSGEAAPSTVVPGSGAPSGLIAPQYPN